MIRRNPDHTAPRRPRPSGLRLEAFGDEADLVRESWEKLLRIRPL